MHAHGESATSDSKLSDTSESKKSDDAPLTGYVPVQVPTGLTTKSPIGTESTTSAEVEQPVGAEPHPVLALAEQARERMKSRPDAFEWKYSPADLISIHNKGAALGLSDKEITDMIFIGSRKAKLLTAEQLTTQMANWKTTVSKRGFPFRFADLPIYQRFCNLLLRLVREAGLPANDVRIQGSALRKTDAGDVDVGIFVAQARFDQALGDAFIGKAKRTKDAAGDDAEVFDARPAPELPLAVTGDDHDALLALAADVMDKAHRNLYNSVAKTWAHAMLQGIVNSKGQALPKLKAAAKEIQQKYAEQNVESLAMLIKNGQFDLDPSMRVRPVEGVGE